MGDEVLDGLDVVDGAGDDMAGALLVEEVMGQALDVGVDADHELVHDPVGGHVGEAAVAVARETADQIGDEEDEGEVEQAGGAAAALGEPLDQAADDEGREEVGEGEEEAAEGGEEDEAAVALDYWRPWG